MKVKERLRDCSVLKVSKDPSQGNVVGDSGLNLFLIKESVAYEGLIA